VYDDPANLFVAKFLGTPPIGVYEAEVKNGGLYIGDAKVFEVKGAPEGKVIAAVRPEGYIVDEKGALECSLTGVEVMGRDISVISTHPATGNTPVRSIVSSENLANIGGTSVRFSLKPHKVDLFDCETEVRIRCELK
jgi:multiple sugar transport system ATP-binding protein